MRKPIISLLLWAILAAGLYSCKDNLDGVAKTATPAETEDAVKVTLVGLDALPKDTGGTQKAHILGATTSPYGFYLYTPSGYKAATGPKFPLIIYLHGSGDIGNSQTKPADLDKILRSGPPKLIAGKKWNPEYPMVVASIQCHEGWWDVPKVQQFTEYMMKNYQIDTTRIYMTGLSMGGYGTWDQLVKLGQKSHITAAVPISGGGLVSVSRTHNAAKTPIWAFHGEADGTVSPTYDIQMHAAINALHPAVPSKLSMYPATGHDAWTKTYDGTGMGKVDTKYDPFAMPIYTWMLQYQKH